MTHKRLNFISLYHSDVHAALSSNGVCLESTQRLPRSESDHPGVTKTQTVEMTIRWEEVPELVAGLLRMMIEEDLETADCVEPTRLIEKMTRLMENLVKKANA